LSKRRSALFVGVGLTGLVVTTAAFALSGGANSAGAPGGTPPKK